MITRTVQMDTPLRLNDPVNVISERSRRFFSETLVVNRATSSDWRWHCWRECSTGLFSFYFIILAARVSPAGPSATVYESLVIIIPPVLVDCNN